MLRRQRRRRQRRCHGCYGDDRYKYCVASLPLFP